MQKYLLIAFILMVNIISGFSQTIAYDTCTTPGGGGGNLVVFANYDGGVLNINVDQNIPNLKIGICTYEPVTINLSGAFVNNVTEVRYAGYVSTTNHHCANSPSTTTITGAPGGATTSVNFLPPSTLSNPNGYGMIICGYTCDNTTNQGGCNTADQIMAYFMTSMSASLYSYYTQYGCWSVAPYNISAGGNCPFVGPADTTITIFSSSSSTACVGEMINFTDLSPGAGTWSWTAPGSSVPTSTGQNLNNVFWTASGNYTVTLSTNDGTGNCSASQLITILDNPTLNPTATPNPICNGDTTDLLASGAFTYQWNPGGPSGNTWSVSPSIDTWYYINGIDLNGCISNDSVLVVVHPTPPATTINYSGGILTATTPASAYQWYLNGSAIVGATSSMYTPVANGNYTVMYTDVNGCESANSLITVVADMGLEISNDAALNVFPNPGTGIFNIAIPLPDNQEALVQVTDALGKVVYSKKVVFIGTYVLDLGASAKGIYQLQLISGSKTYTKKLIIR
jgi:hypothetical protein